MIGKLLLLLLVLPALDLYLLVLIGAQIGVLPTLAMLAVSAMLGVSLARAEGLRVLRTFQDALASGEAPPEGVASGLLVLLGGALLVLPGVLSDVIGVLLLVPFTRRLCVRLLLSRLQQGLERGTLRVVHLQGGTYGAPFPPGHGAHGRAREIIDVEGEVLPPPEAAPTPRALPKEAEPRDE